MNLVRIEAYALVDNGASNGLWKKPDSGWNAA